MSAKRGQIKGVNNLNENNMNAGLYIIPLGLLAASAYSFYKVYVGYNSGTTQQTTTGIVETDGKVIPKGPLFFGVMMLLAAIAISLAIYSENRPYDPKKDGPLPTKVEDGRVPAEELLNK